MALCFRCPLLSSHCTYHKHCMLQKKNSLIIQYVLFALFFCLLLNCELPESRSAHIFIFNPHCLTQGKGSCYMTDLQKEGGSKGDGEREGEGARERKGRRKGGRKGRGTENRHTSKGH